MSTLFAAEPLLIAMLEADLDASVSVSTELDLPADPDGTPLLPNEAVVVSWSPPQIRTSGASECASVDLDHQYLVTVVVRSYNDRSATHARARAGELAHQVIRILVGRYPGPHFGRLGLVRALPRQMSGQHLLVPLLFSTPTHVTGDYAEE